jgi:RNA polymerase sigma factor (sigma-70 family)
MADQRTRAGARGDEADLFRAYNLDLMRLVANGLHGSTPEVVEDACSFAWAQFMRHQPDRGQNWRGWLYRTAQREAWALSRESREAKPLRTAEEERLTEFADVADPRDPHALNARVSEALSIVRQLPPRLQRIAMMRALGLRYREIGELTGDTVTRVAQLVAQANAQIYDIIAERAHHERESAPRAERLWQLEHEQPAWLVEQLGRVPRSYNRRLSLGTRLRTWRRAALALDDLRELVGPRRFVEALRTRPQDPELRRAHDVARRALDDHAHEIGRERRIGD